MCELKCSCYFLEVQREKISPGLSKDILIHALLSAGEAALQDVLILFWQLLFHFSFGAPQNERLNHLAVR